MRLLFEGVINVTLENDEDGEKVNVATFISIFKNSYYYIITLHIFVLFYFILLSLSLSL